jgi:hypothetical protein
MPWVKGQSGNPKGSSKRAAQIARLVRSNTGDGLELVEFALAVFRGDHDADLDQRIDMMKWLADRGYGKAVETVEVVEDKAASAVLPTPELADGLGPSGVIQ